MPRVLLRQNVNDMVRISDARQSSVSDNPKKRDFHKFLDLQFC
jgi:hypothetical protein